MTAAAALARAEAAGVRLWLQDGRVRMRAASPPPPDVLDDLRRHREELARTLARRRQAYLLSRAASSAAAAVAAPDDELLRERAGTAEARTAEAAGHHGAPMAPADRRRMLDGLRAAALHRPPAWSDPDSAPPPGAWCSCCGRFARRGGRWWRARRTPRGWCCRTCHPPDHLAPDEVEEVRT